jgi:hypothetical protein
MMFGVVPYQTMEFELLQVHYASLQVKYIDAPPKAAENRFRRISVLFNENPFYFLQ